MEETTGYEFKNSANELLQRATGLGLQHSYTNRPRYMKKCIDAEFYIFTTEINFFVEFFPL